MHLLFTALLSISCNPSSEGSPAEKQYTVGDQLLVQSLSYSRTEGNQTIRLQDDYEYEDGRIISRVETNLDYGKTRIFTYTYSNDIISDIQIHNANDELESEINIYYNENNQVYSYEYTANLNTNSSTYSLATFSYENNQILLCDGKSWSSVEYKDVYDSILIYTTNDDGNVVQVNEIEDCYLSAPSINGEVETSQEYDDNPSPFINIFGNNLILNTIISPFTDSRTNGFYNNAINQTRYPDQSNQTWIYEYNSARYPSTIQWSLEDIQEHIEIVYY